MFIHKIKLYEKEQERITQNKKRGCGCGIKNEECEWMSNTRKTPTSPNLLLLFFLHWHWLKILIPYQNIYFFNQHLWFEGCALCHTSRYFLFQITFWIIKCIYNYVFFPPFVLKFWGLSYSQTSNFLYFLFYCKKNQYNLFYRLSLAS